MPEAPKPVGLILCDRMHVDPAAAKLSLVGLFTFLRFSSFPTPARGFTVYAQLYGGKGEGRMKLEVKRADTEAPIYRKEMWRGFPAPDQISTTEVPVRRCAFPAPGRYIITLYFEHEELTHTVLDIIKE